MLKQCTKEKTLVMCSIIKLVHYFCCTCATHYNTCHKVKYFYTDTNKMVIRMNNINFSEHIVSYAKEKKRKKNRKTVSITNFALSSPGAGSHTVKADLRVEFQMVDLPTSLGVITGAQEFTEQPTSPPTTGRPYFAFRSVP